MNEIERTRKMLVEAIYAIRSSLEGSTSTTMQSVSRDQLLRFEEELEQMLFEVETGTVPQKDKRRGGMARVIIDSWPVKSSLGEIIISAEHAYKNL